MQACTEAAWRPIVETLKDALPGVRLTLIEPSPYDEVNHPLKCEGGYNAVMLRYGEIVKEIAAKNHCDLVGFNALVVEVLKKVKAEDPKLATMIIPDAVHPARYIRLTYLDLHREELKFAPNRMFTTEVEAYGPSK